MKHTRKKKYLRTKRRYTKSRGSRRYKRKTNRRKRGGDDPIHLNPCKYKDDEDEAIKNIAKGACAIAQKCKNNPNDCDNEDLAAALESLKFSLDNPELTYEQVAEERDQEILQDIYIQAAKIEEGDNNETITEKHKELLKKLDQKNKHYEIEIFKKIYDNIIRARDHQKR
jgi:type III secretion system FlhB-like substrate exporter